MDVPSCSEVVQHSDQLTIEWAARESQEKAEAMRQVIDKETAVDGRDPAVELCKRSLTDAQKYCVVSASDLLEKNECLKTD